ncbi:polyadenylate-binding protein RBP47 isoform X1 [Cryptomeria japonica]|uniref:polyadenylate-binding protein RBP47 isoform X1 n=1 Tax=Cryptomeria japonica TaxID=3369 RepID=UPI0025AC8D41|nr:polyadenylate-binding protein RBP47 isoform X1 [Cryptomeria japonica]
MMQPTPGAGPPLADANTQQQQQQQWMQHQQMMMDMQQQQVNQGMVMQQQQAPPQQQHHPQAPYQQQQAFYPNQPQYQQQQQPMQMPPQQQHQQPMSSDEVKTLWVGDLLFWMDENYLHSCFAHTGEVISAKVIRNKHTGQSEGYGFMEFVSRASAEKVLHSYNGTVMPNTEQAFRLNWASFSMGERRTDGGPDHSIFVGDLASDVTDLQLQETFQSRYPSVKGAKVVIDSVTGRSKGYGFVRFGDENERARAMSEMNGQYCSTRPMRISAATPRKSAGFQQPYPSRAGSNGHQSQGFQSDPDINNTTIFVGGLDPNATDDDLRQIFGQFGELVSVKIPVGKGCGFVQFGSRASAEEALQRLHGTIIGQQTIRLSWGRSPANKQQQQHQGQPQADPNQWNGAYYGQGYETYGYAPPPQDPAMYAYGAYPGYGNYHQQVS